MKENQLQVNSSGVWLKTTEEKTEEWRELLKETLEFHDYKQLATTPSKDSYYLPFKHSGALSYEGCESLFVNFFKNGHIRIETNLIESLFESIIPHFEAKINVKFDWARGWEKYTYSPHVLHYLNGRPDLYYHGDPWWYKKRAEVAAEVKRRDEVDDATHSKIQEDLEATQRRLACAKDELCAVSTTHARMQGEIADAKEKICCAKQELDNVNQTHVQMEEELDDTTKKLTSAKEELSTVTEALSAISVDANSYNESRRENLQHVFDGHYAGYPGYPGYPGHHRYLLPGVHPAVHPQFYSREFSWVPDGKGGWKRRSFWEC